MTKEQALHFLVNIARFAALYANDPLKMKQIQEAEAVLRKVI